MFANKYVLFSLLILVFIGTSCIPSATPTFPTIRPEPTISLQQQPTSTVFIGIPPIHDPLIQSDNESEEEFIVRIAATKIISERPFLIALSQMESKGDLWEGVSPEIKDMEECWIVDEDSVKQCEKEDIRNYIGNPNALKIFFASAYSDSGQDLIVLDDYHPKIENDTIDGYRLVLELKDGKWIEKSLTTVY